MASTSVLDNLHQWRIFKVAAWAGILSVSIVSLIGLQEQAAVGATKVKFTYGAFGQSLTVDELKSFAETGRPSSKLKFFLNAADQDPEVVRNVLTKEVKISLKLADRVLYFLPGEYALFQAGQIFHTPGRVANIQALRSGVILSLSDDSKISLLEFLEKYPLSEMTIDGIRLARTAGQIDRIVSRLAPKAEAGAAIANELLESLVCDCDSAATPATPTVEPTPSPQPAPETPSPQTSPETPSPQPSPDLEEPPG